MFQPRGPNFRLSRMIAWKKQMEKSNFLNVSGFVVRLMSSSDMLLYDCIKLARRPLAGSFVILTPFCRTETGNLGVGPEVNHRRKSSWQLSGLKSVQMASRVGSQLTAKWQFCNRTHPPRFRPSSMSFLARGPWPCPKEMDWNFSLKPWSLANSRTLEAGSAPLARTKMRGVVLLEASKESGRSKVGKLLYSGPNDSAMKICRAGAILSGRRHFKTSSFWKVVSFSAQGSGSTSRWGVTESKYRLKLGMLSRKVCSKPE
mmetsp:Transcript_35680/g.70018  ORF Transcript_35680/g.70018 Transcript_35680/m.70018 type:complete len:259 (-) Transcript_35680:1689-2465(-)